MYKFWNKNDTENNGRFTKGFVNLLLSFRYEAILLFRISDDNIVGKEKVSKWNKNAETAIYQIREKQYPEFLKQYTGKILLVGISYDKKQGTFMWNQRNIKTTFKEDANGL